MQMCHPQDPQNHDYRTSAAKAPNMAGMANQACRTWRETYIVPARQTKNIFWCPIIKKWWFGGGISYVAFDLKFTSRQVGFFPREMGFLEFCSHNIFRKKLIWHNDFSTRLWYVFEGRGIITFWWFSNLLFNWISFYQLGSSTKITQYTSMRRELANPTVPLIIPKFEFLTEKQGLKVKNHHFLMVFFSVCRARKIRRICAVVVAADALHWLHNHRNQRTSGTMIRRRIVP